MIGAQYARCLAVVVQAALDTVGLNVDLGSFFELAELLDRNELMDA